jgi:type II secretory pathway pseudopilin PulG
MPTKKLSKSTKKNQTAKKAAPAKLKSAKTEKSEVEVLASAPEKPAPKPKSNNEKTITLGELLLAVLIIGGLFLFGYRKAINIKNTGEDSAKYYKAEAMAAQLDLYFKEKGQYPLESNLQDADWLKLNPRLEVLQDDGYGSEIGSDMFKYVVYPEGCNNDTVQCDGFKLDIYSTSDDQTIQQTGGSGDDHAGEAADQTEDEQASDIETQSSEGGE